MPAKSNRTRYRLAVSELRNQRLAATSGVLAASGLVGVGIVGVMIVGNVQASSNKDGMCYNTYPQTVSDPITGERRVYLNKRPGSTSAFAPQAGSIGNALYTAVNGGLAGKKFSAFGATNSSIYDSAVQLATNNGDPTVITGKATGITETEISGTGTLAITSSDSTAWYYQAAGTVTKIVDADYPGNAGKAVVGTFAHMDGFAIVMTSDGYLYASDINSVINWSATSFGPTNAYPDGGIGCVRWKNYVMAFGRMSIEFWQNVGASPFPFQRNPSMTLKIGAASANAIVSLSDFIFWIGTTPEGGLSMFKFDGAASRLSTPEIETYFALYGANNITLSIMRYAGRSFVLAICSSQLTLAYCIEENSWDFWLTAAAPFWSKTATEGTGATAATYMLSTTDTGGKVYLVNPAAPVFQDNGASYSATIQWPKQDFNNSLRKIHHQITFIGDQQTLSSPMSLSYSDDDAQSFTVWGTLDLSQDCPVALRLGSTRRRIWSVSHSANTPFRMEALEGWMTQGYA